jgi:hypothetical protein
MSDGSVRLTSPLWSIADQLWTSTGTVMVSPTPMVWAAGDRPNR